MILIALLLAPTVPSDPNPQNLHSTVPSLAVETVLVTSKEVLVTSSLIAKVNPFLRFSSFK